MGSAVYSLTNQLTDPSYLKLKLKGGAAAVGILSEIKLLLWERKHHGFKKDEIEDVALSLRYEQRDVERTVDIALSVKLLIKNPSGLIHSPEVDDQIDCYSKRVANLKQNKRTDNSPTRHRAGAESVPTQDRVDRSDRQDRSDKTGEAR